MVKVKAMVVMSHRLTKEQVVDLRKNHNVDDILYLDHDDQVRFSNVDPEMDFNRLGILADDISDSVYKALNGVGVLIVQGEPGLCFNIIRTLERFDIGCVYATTKRESVETVNEDTGEVTKTMKFNHIQFRKYS